MGFYGLIQLQKVESKAKLYNYNFEMLFIN